MRDALSDLVGRADRGGKRESAQAAGAWADAVGPEIAARTRAVGVREGTLLVLVDSSTWATELTAISSHLAEAVNARVGSSRVSGVRFTVSREVGLGSGPHREMGESGAAVTGDAKVEAAPLTPEEVAQIEHVAAAVSDSELRRAMVRAMVADMAWKKGVRGEG